MRLAKASLMLGILGFSGVASAVPSLTFIIDGDTFSQPYAITNSSTAGERVVRFQLDLSTIAPRSFCYDTVDNANCNSGSVNAGVAFAATGGTGASTGLVGAPVVADATKLLDISFNNFDAGETFEWVIDVDEANGVIADQTVSGNELIGATALVDFSDGQRLTGVLAAVPGNDLASQFTVTGTGPIPIPEPTSLALLGLGLGALGFIRRQSPRLGAGK
mgnify:CR=1 FL=1